MIKMTFYLLLSKQANNMLFFFYQQQRHNAPLLCCEMCVSALRCASAFRAAFTKSTHGIKVEASFWSRTPFSALHLMMGKNTIQLQFNSCYSTVPMLITWAAELGWQLLPVFLLLHQSSSPQQEVDRSHNPTTDCFKLNFGKTDVWDFRINGRQHEQ